MPAVNLSISQEWFDKNVKPAIDSLEDWQLSHLLILTENEIAKRIRNPNKHRAARRAKRSFKEKVRLANKRVERQVRIDSVSYERYMESELWATIRADVLNRDSGRCVVCGAEARCVHHRSYDPHTMAGKCRYNLVSMCHGCHRDIHFDGEIKVLAETVDARLIWRLSSGLRMDELHEEVREDMLQCIPA